MIFPAPDDYTSLTQDLTFNGAVNNVCKTTIIVPDSMNEVAAETFTMSLNSTDRAVVLGQSTTITIGRLLTSMLIPARCWCI